MTETIITALITGGLALLGTIISNQRTARDIDAKLETRQAVTEAHMEDLTREVRKHNGFGEKIPAIEGHLAVIDEQVKVANHRINDLEKFHAPKN